MISAGRVMMAATAGEITADLAFVVVTIIATLVAGRLGRIAIGAVIRRVASRSLLGANSAWRVRVPRLIAETVPVAELRREHRINATAAMISRMLKVLLWVAAIVVVLDRLEVDLLIAVSGAGFLGAAVAIGGQNSVHDYLNGLHILLEDRFGEGDRVSVVLDTGDPISGTVSRVGAFAARIETDEGTYHLANRRAFQVLNLSQRSYPQLFEFQVDRVLDDLDAKQAVVSAVKSASAQAHLPADLGMVVEHVTSQPGRRGRSTIRVAARFSGVVSDDDVSRLSAALGEVISRR